MKRVPLTQGQFAIVDDGDFERVSALKWFAQRHKNTFYAKRWQQIGGKQKQLPMPNFLLGVPIGVIVDHIDRAGLNNQRANLRQATKRQNGCNIRKRLGCSSSYIGVSWCRIYEKWRAYIEDETGTRKHLGYFDDEIEAARAYNAAALVRDPEFKNLNKI